MFQKNNLKIINADCIDIIKNYEDNYFDLAIVDPPYGIEISCNPIRQKHKKKNWDNAIPSKKYFDEIKRVSKNQIIWGGNYFLQYLGNTQCFFIWDKKQPFNFSLAMCEMAWTSFNKPAKIFRQSVLKERGKIHPTQKPVKLYQWLLENYANKDNKILDTHLGSASSAIAAFYYGCKEFVGIEIDKDYYNDSIKRIKEHTIQTKLF